MRKLPEILRVKGILYNYTDYQVGTIERAKSLFAEIWTSSQLTGLVIRQWDAAKQRILEERAWEVLGKPNPEVILREVLGERYDLIELGKVSLSPNSTIGEAEEKGRSLSQQAAQMVLDGTAKTQAEAAERLGISRPAVCKAMDKLTKNSQWEDLVNIPDHITGNSSQADFRKLSPAGQERVRNGEPLNRVAIQEGIRRQMGFLDQALKLLPKLKPDELDELARAIIEAKAEVFNKAFDEAVAIAIAKSKPKAKRK